LKSVKSRLSKKLSADSCNLVSPVEVKCSHDLHGLGFILITQEFSDPRVFEGKRYFGSLSGKAQKTSGKPAIFANLPSDKVNSIVEERTLNLRVSFVFSLLSILSGMSVKQSLEGYLISASLNS